MSQHKTAPRLINEGVLFTVTVDSLDRECLIKEDALKQFTVPINTDAAEADTMDVFHAFENRISGVARRLVAAGVQGTPLILTHSTFFSPPHRM